MKVERLPDSAIPEDLPAYYLEHFRRYRVIQEARARQPGAPNVVDPLHQARVTATIDMLFQTAKDGFKSVVDIGAGPGYYTYRLAYWYTDIWAYDIIPDYVEVLKRIDYVTPFIADANELVLTRNFDVVVACEVLEHLREPRAAIERWMPHCKRFFASSPIHEDLNPEGAFDLSRLETPTTPGDTTGHIWSVDMAGFQSWFSGYEILQAVEAGTSGLLMVKGGLA